MGQAAARARAATLDAMLTLNPAQRRDLRARAHRLHPVVSVGQHGLTASVLHEIDVNLLAHELIKVRVFNLDRETRDAVMGRICAELDAAPVQHIGKLLVVWRPAPPAALPERGPSRPRARRDRAAAAPKPTPGRRRPAPRDGKAATQSAAKSTPRTRRPREPVARTPARPQPAQGRRVHGGPPPAGGRRKRGVPSA